jgi:hypothetical protein
MFPGPVSLPFALDGRSPAPPSALPAGAPAPARQATRLSIGPAIFTARHVGKHTLDPVSEEDSPVQYTMAASGGMAKVPSLSPACAAPALDGRRPHNPIRSGAQSFGAAGPAAAVAAKDSLQVLERLMTGAVARNMTPFQQGLAAMTEQMRSLGATLQDVTDQLTVLEAARAQLSHELYSTSSPSMAARWPPAFSTTASAPIFSQLPVR